MALDGAWINELGSTLVLKSGPEGALSGSYETAVGTCAQGKFPVAGRTDVTAGGETLGFAVSWKNSQSECNSTTTWVGHYRSGDASEEESIVAFWVMADKTGPEDEWESTTLGRDVFHRQVGATEAAASEEESSEAANVRPANP